MFRACSRAECWAVDHPKLGSANLQADDDGDHKTMTMMMRMMAMMVVGDCIPTGDDHHDNDRPPPLPKTRCSLPLPLPPAEYDYC